MTRFITVEERDLQQLTILVKVFAEGRFDVKGDSILPVANALRHLAGLVDRVKNAQELPVPTPPEERPVLARVTKKDKTR